MCARRHGDASSCARPGLQTTHRHLTEHLRWFGSHVACVSHSACAGAPRSLRGRSAGLSKGLGPLRGAAQARGIHCFSGEASCFRGLLLLGEAIGAGRPRIVRAAPGAMHRRPQRRRQLGDRAGGASVHHAPTVWDGSDRHSLPRCGMCVCVLSGVLSECWHVPRSGLTHGATSSHHSHQRWYAFASGLPSCLP